MSSKTISKLKEMELKFLLNFFSMSVDVRLVNRQEGLSEDTSILEEVKACVRICRCIRKRQCGKNYLPSDNAS